MFYDRLLDLCRENDKKITPVVRELGLSTGGIARWRNGSSPDGDTLYKIAEYFDVSTDYLLGKSDIKKPSDSGELDERLSEEEFALYGEVKDLTDEEKQRVLDFIKFTKSQRKKIRR